MIISLNHISTFFKEDFTSCRLVFKKLSSSQWIAIVKNVDHKKSNHIGCFLAGTCKIKTRTDKLSLIRRYKWYCVAFTLWPRSIMI